MREAQRAAGAQPTPAYLAPRAPQIHAQPAALVQTRIQEAARRRRAVRKFVRHLLWERGARQAAKAPVVLERNAGADPAPVGAS